MTLDNCSVAKILSCCCVADVGTKTGERVQQIFLVLQKMMIVTEHVV